MKIAVVDGQGGGIGKALCRELSELKKDCPDIEILAVGTNSLATSAMAKSADRFATGENAVSVVVRDADVITGPIGILSADSMLGELTPNMALAIAKSPAQKVVIPLGRCHILVAGVKSADIGENIRNAVSIIRDFYIQGK